MGDLPERPCDVCNYVFAFGVLPGGVHESVWRMELCAKHFVKKHQRVQERWS